MKEILKAIPSFIFCAWLGGVQLAIGLSLIDVHEAHLSALFIVAGVILTSFVVVVAIAANNEAESFEPTNPEKS